ncbi:ema family member protein [Theileria equi strain WA]|uniref:Ema family member protein n=1 Tax=Theileria equi strain WA TaxID=1537102 RepID=L1L995_THEEQ|nr:ema family member protein [Theileria equi strain WA]EKX72071.1 ema family member protein [Theileria equi strain WA]|eukprot:XP_004831523.1 ema family member protein [Theileria equi strain WA]
MRATSLILVISLAISGTLAAKVHNCSSATVNIANDVNEQYNVITKVDENHIVYTTAEGYAFKKVVDNLVEVATFDLKATSPKTVTKYLIDDGIYVTVAMEPSQHFAYKKRGNEYVKLNLVEFYENVLFKDFEKVTIDADKCESAVYFDASSFGSGKMYEFPSSLKRPLKVMSAGKQILGVPKEVLIDVVIYVSGSDKILRIGYVSRDDSRIKEVFYQKVRTYWSPVTVSAAAKVLHAMNSAFPADYESLYDGCPVLTVLFSVAALALFVLFQ